MLVKFETKSARVKGVSFHPKRPWVLASLHNGNVQLWDYRLGTLVANFEEHDGPVRGVAFHSTQPLFVSGGDDYKIKVWNYKQHKCLFTLNGHLDYVRTVFFHHEYPWIISASDDQTIRIWNWQSRNCLTILTGHTHYVMCAQFHPKEDLVVSASLDQTVRVWDISGLRKKNTNAPTATRYPDDISRTTANIGSNQADMFGNTDVLVKYVLEGHDRGVNWASFHHTLPLIVSGADDRQVKLWRMSDTKAWEVDTLRGHFNNVSCVLFHPRQELIISNGEDKSVRVWDMSKRIGPQTFRREAERFWILVAHPEHNLFAAGHDNGLVVFKFERERPAYTIYQNSLFYIRDKNIRYYDLSSQKDVGVLSFKKALTFNNQPRTISYNAAENSVILTSPIDGGIYEIYQLPRDFMNNMGDGPEATDVKKGSGSSAVFVARNRYAVFNSSNQSLEIKNLNNDASKSITLSGTYNEIFYAGIGQLLIVSDTKVLLYDIQTSQQINELAATRIRYVYWNNEMNLVAFVGRHEIVIANQKLEQLCKIYVAVRIKSGVWDESGVFIYNTLNHIEYVLPNGDSGIICSMENTMYLVKCSGSNLVCLDRSVSLREVPVNQSEYRFKLALNRKRYDEVLNIIKNSDLVGQAIIAYLTTKGYPDVALQFVKDPKTRFDLALECGRLDVALEMAKTIEQEDCWASLATAALKQGNLQMVEMSHQRVKDFEKLSFSYLISGSRDKLEKLDKIAALRNDVMSQFNYSMLLGDVESQISILSESGLHSLAYATAKKYGLVEKAEEILSSCGKSSADVSGLESSNNLIRPLKPLGNFGAGNWPCLPLPKGFFDQTYKQPPIAVVETKKETVFMETPVSSAAVEAALPENVNASWGLDDDLDIDLPHIAPSSAGAQKTTGEAVNDFPHSGPSFSEIWTRNSSSVVDQVAAGSFESAMQLLNVQLGITNFEPLKPYFMSLFLSSRSSNSGLIGSIPSFIYPLHRNWKENSKNVLPNISITLTQSVAILQQAYTATTGGQFQQAITLFRKILIQNMFLIANSHQEAEVIEGMIPIVREYIVGLSMELKRRELGDGQENMKRSVELAAYFTHCQLQPVHLMLSLQLAMNQAARVKCFQTTSIFIKRLLELGPNAQIAEKARKLQAVVETSLKDEIKLDYSPLNQFVICAQSFTPIYDPSKVKKCPYCAANYQESFKGLTCTICQVAQIGKSASGFKIGIQQK